MAAQMNYSYETAKGIPGGKYDLSVDTVVTRQNEAADGKVGFGMVLVVGTSAGTQVKIPSATGDKIEGVCLKAHNVEQDMSGNTIVKNGCSLSIMTRGKVWAKLAPDITPTYGQAVYVVATGDNAGCVTNANSGTIAYTGAKFLGVNDTGIAAIAINE